MRVAKVEYTVKPDYVEVNKANIRKVMDELYQMGDVGVQYFTSIKEDGRSFVHIALTRDEEAAKVISNLSAFKQFRMQLKDGAEIPPAAEVMNLVGKSFDF